jgi:hypothetical protein
MMGRSMGLAEKMFAEIAREFDTDDEDDMPPPPDTSTPQGEKAAELFEILGKAQANMGGMMEQLARKMQQQQNEGFVGEAANDQRRYNNPEAAAKAIRTLEAYERSKGASSTERSEA